MFVGSAETRKQPGLYLTSGLPGLVTARALCCCRWARFMPVRSVPELSADCANVDDLRSSGTPHMRSPERPQLMLILAHKQPSPAHQCAEVGVHPCARALAQKKRTRRTTSYSQGTQWKVLLEWWAAPGPRDSHSSSGGTRCCSRARRLRPADLAPSHTHAHTHARARKDRADPGSFEKISASPSYAVAPRSEPRGSL